MTTPSIDMSQVSTVLLDIGGVLIQLHGSPFKADWLPAGETDRNVWPFWLRSTAVRAFEQGHIDGNEFAQAFIDEAGLNVGAEDFIEHFMRWPARLFPGVPDMLETLARRYRLAALSNSNALHWPMIMQRFELESMIPDCISSHQIGVMKPDRMAFDFLLSRLELKPEEILFLDDYQASVDMARSMGMQAAKVTGTVGGVQTAGLLGLLDE
jgi:putative hydrolase of the HAD superfamily